MNKIYSIPTEILNESRPLKPVVKPFLITIGLALIVALAGWLWTK